MKTLNVACDLKTRQTVWVGRDPKTGKILSGPAYVWAAMGRKGAL